MRDHKRIDLTTLVSQEKMKFIESIDGSEFLITTVNIRGTEVKYFTNNKRLLWIAVGLEYIEPELLDWIDTIEEDRVFYDIGASNGPFSIYAAMKGLKVIAIEPEAQNFALLEMNHYLNSNVIKYPVISLNIAISSKAELGKLFCEKYEGGMHCKILDKPLKVLQREKFEPAHCQYVIKNTLDNIIHKYKLPCPEYLKIDVDGSELELLKGAKRTLEDENVRSIFIEISNPDFEGKKIVEYVSLKGFGIKEMKQVQHYEGLYNFIFTRQRKYSIVA